MATMASPLSVYFVTFNCGRSPIDVDTFAWQFFRSRQRDLPYPDLVVLSLQEIAPIAYSFLGPSWITPFSSRFAKLANKSAEPEQKYVPVMLRNVGMTALIILAKPEVKERVEWRSSAGVGVGHWEMGNKGAVGARLGLKQTGGGSRIAALTFVAAHLAPFEDAVERRNEDWRNIVRNLAFSSPRPYRGGRIRQNAATSDETQPLLADGDQHEEDPESAQFSSMFIPDSPVFLGGDLNYRTRDVGPSQDDHESFPQPTDDGDPSSPKSFSIEKLKKGDQLARELQAGKTLHQLAEMPVNFPPTYKYTAKDMDTWMTSKDEPRTWQWAKHRFPSWCDRILFSAPLKDREHVLKVHTYTALPLQRTSDHRPVAMHFTLDLAALSDPAVGLAHVEPPFALAPDWAERRDAARWREMFTGVGAFVGCTWEGNGFLVASALAGVIAWFVIQSTY